MESETINVIAAALLEQHGHALPDDELRRTLGLLPDVDTWAIAEHMPAAFAISGEAVFTVRVRKGGRVSVECRRLDRDKLVVTMASKAVSRGKNTITREVSWTFRFLAEAKAPSRAEWQNITGRVYTDVHQGGVREDPREKLARALAGWPALPAE
jgi:hypothetical protein